MVHLDANAIHGGYTKGYVNRRSSLTFNAAA